MRRVDAVVTVNEALADHCQRDWPFRERPTVLLNCQPRWDAAGRRVRTSSARRPGCRPSARIVLFLGRLGRQRGLEVAAEAVLRLRDAALVMLGLRRTMGGPRCRRTRRGSAVRRPARHAAAGPSRRRPVWAASADVSIIAVPANSLNQRLSTPNKFWESLAAGTPVVIGRDLEVMRGIVEADRLGAVADPADPDDLARALREVLEQPPERATRRCATVASRSRATATTGRPRCSRYLDLVERLRSAATAAPAS